MALYTIISQLSLVHIGVTCHALGFRDCRRYLEGCRCSCGVFVAFKAVHRLVFTLKLEVCLAVVKSCLSNKFGERTIRMTLRAFSRNAFVVRIVMTCYAIIVRDIRKFLKFLTIFCGHGMALFTIKRLMFPGKFKISRVMIEFGGRSKSFHIVTGNAVA